RFRLTDPRLRQWIDSTDVCQSVFNNLFLRLAMGQFDVDEPKKLLGLLATMATNKVVDWNRAQCSARRDQRKVAPLEEADQQAANAVAAETPSGHLSYLELLQQCQGLLDDEEKSLTHLRKSGKSWNEIADHLGGTPDGHRKRFQRCMDRVSQQLKLEPCQD
ncbi:MAG: ECF-type sigma factor, partial [Planctomycetota bacterium]